MKPARRKTTRQTVLPVFGVLALALAATAGCSAAAGGNGGVPTAVPSVQTPLVPAQPAPTGTPSAAANGATSSAKARVESALTKLAARESQPATEQIRSALVEAGFPRRSIEVTASRTPTGLQADAVQAAVRQGRDCVVGQVRNGTVAVTVLTVLADGRCFAGSPA